MTITVQVKMVKPQARVPAYATAGAAGMDLHAALEGNLTLAPGGRMLVPTGITMHIPDGYVGLIFARSGLAAKHGISLANGVGVIDADYRGEILVALQNTGTEAYTIAPGDRVAQMVFMPVAQAQLVQVSALADTERGAGGFGSTGG